MCVEGWRHFETPFSSLKRLYTYQDQHLSKSYSMSQKTSYYTVPKMLLIFFITCFFRIVSNDIVVNTSSGPVRGVSSLSEDVEAFLGIPYAEPPTGELRFSKPIPKTQWTETYDASHLPPPCPQLDVGSYYFSPDRSKMSEDCLHLNLWIPKSESNGDLKPIVIFIHPGAFIAGSSNLKAHDGSNLASRGDLVVVTINYRLGALGFLSTDTEEAAGNMGMYDQIVAIKWVKENARKFKGDPENIVLMGASAGAYSVSAHMVSPLSKNLFKRAIVQSGSIMSLVLANDNDKLYKNSQSFSSMIGCTNATTDLTSDTHSVLKCLKEKPVDDIIAAEQKLFGDTPLLFFPKVGDEFLPKNAVNLFREGKFRQDVDALIGNAKEEGSLLLITILKDYLGTYGKDNASMSKIRATTIARAFLLGVRGIDSRKMIKYYMNQMKNRTSIGYIKMMAQTVGDLVVNCNAVFLADFLAAKGNPVYFYKFDFLSPSTPLAEWVGVTHLDELQYVFGNPYHANFTPEETELSYDLIDHWSAFARTGNPNIQGHIPWPRYSYNNPLYLNFGQEEESIRWKPSNRCEEWRKPYNAELDTELIQFLKNSGMNDTN